MDLSTYDFIQLSEDTEQPNFEDHGIFEQLLRDVYFSSRSAAYENFAEDATEDTEASEASGSSETIVVSSSCDEDILLQLQVTNNLLGIQLALNIFLLAFAFLKFVYKIIRNNVTNLI